MSGPEALNSAGDGMPSRRAFRVVAGGAAFILALLLGSMLFVPWIVKDQLVDFVVERTGVTPTLERVSFNPLRLRLALSAFAFHDSADADSILAFDELVIDLDLFGFLNADLALDELVLTGPRVSAEINETGELNLARVISRMAEASAPTDDVEEETESDAFIVDVAAIRIEAGELHFRDRARSPMFETRVSPLDLELTEFTTRAGGSSPVDLSLHLGESSRLDWTGHFGVEPLQASGQVEIERLDLRLGWQYLAEQLRFEVADGFVDASAHYLLDLRDGMAVTVEAGSIALSTLRVLDRVDGAEVISLPRVDVGGMGVRTKDAAVEEVVVTDVTFDGGRLAMNLEADGSISLVELLRPVGDPPESEQAEAEPAEPSAAGRTDDRTNDGTIAPSVRVDRFALEQFRLDLEDRRGDEPIPIRFDAIDLEIRDFKSTPDPSFDLDLVTRLNDEGQIAVTGAVQLEPLVAGLEVQGDKIRLTDFQGYLKPFAKVALSRGEFSATLDVSVDGPAGEVAETSVLAIGRLQIDDLLANDLEAAEEVLGWQSLRIEGLEASSAGLAIKEVALSKATASFLIGTDGESNLARMFVSTGDEGEDTSKSASDSSGDPYPIAIDRVSLDDLGFRFRDRSVEPDFPMFAMDLDALSGTIDGLSSDPDERASVELTGTLDQSAPIKISGVLNPLAAEVFTDLSATVSGVSMPSFAPYSGKFVGYGIDRGKLDLAVNYRLDASSLDAENRLSLEKFAIGERVGNAATRVLPVPLAVALMRDSTGRIAIDLPVHGDLDDPNFDLLSLLGKTFLNLITRVAATPFAVVGNLVGGSSEDLESVVFAPGSDRLTDSEDSELGALAEALSARPALRLEIQGSADPELDGPALRVARIEQEIRRSVFDSLSREERERLGGPEALELTAERRLAELKALYEKRVGPLPDALATPAGSEAVEGVADPVRQRADAVLATLATQIELAESDWQGLARARAATIQSALLGASAVDPARIFMVDVEVGPVANDGSVAAKLSLAAD